MSRRVRILVSSILLVLLSAAGALWFSADLLLDGVARHWLIAKSATALDAEVQLARLTYTDGRLRFSELTIAQPGTLQLEVAAIEVQFSWTGLLQRRIDELVISQPHLVWTAPTSESTSAPTAWPQAAPLQIDAWRLENGRAEVNWGGRQFTFDRFMAEGGLGDQYPLVVQASSGPAPGTSFRLAGNTRWQNGLALTLDELSWNDKNLLTRSVTISPGPEQGLSTQLGLDQLNDQDVAELLAVLDQPLPWPKDLHWQLTAPVIDLRLQGEHLDVSLQAGAGALQTADQRWPWLSMRLQVRGEPSRLELAGNLALAGSTTLGLTGVWADQQLNGRWDVTVANPADLLQIVGLAMPASTIKPTDLQLQGLIEAGPDSARISEVTLTSRLGELGSLSGHLSGEWREERLTLACDRLVVITHDGELLAEATMALEGNPSIPALQGDWSLKVADTSRFASQVGGSWPDGLPDLVDLSLQGKLKLQADRLSLSVVDLVGKLAAEEFSGRLHGRFALHTDAAVDLAVTLEALTLDAFDYQAADGMAGLLGGQLVLNGQLDLVGEDLNFDLSGRAGAVEALMGPWYGSLSALPVGFHARGKWLHDPQQLKLTGVDVDLAGLASGRFAGSYTEQATSLSGQIEVPKLQGAFLKTLQALVGELLPDMQSVALEGQLKLDGVAQQHGEIWALDLAIIPSDVNVAWGQKLMVDGLHGRLPLQLRSDAPPADEPAEAASLKWARLKGGVLDSGPGQLKLLTSTNRWRLQQPFELTAAGGQVIMTTLQLDLPKLVPQLRAGLELKALELLQISRYLEWPEMGGLLNARLEEIRIAGDEISTVGEASMQIFGGIFSVSNMRVEAPFSRFPTYHADVDFSGVDLYQLTNTFEFGEMNGIADGFIHDLRLFDGTPSALRAKLETRSEGTRNISVKAIRNLNTLSQGGLSSALSQGLYQFIDFYRYQKIGIFCWLQNDAFHIEGTGRTDSNQYLVYGGLLPPRIDVTVSSPTVSFKEMVRRLKRIERTER